MSVSRETLTVDVSRETLQRLTVFEDLLTRWNRRINLVSPGDIGALRQRHTLDAFQLLPFLPTGLAGGLDIGSGAGFPGLILAIASGIPFTLLEADARKCAFLREAARATDAPVQVVCARAETATLPASALITARALAPLKALLDLTTPHLAQGGVLLFLKGATVDTEIAEAETAWSMTLQKHTSQTHPSGVILRITEARRAT